MSSSTKIKLLADHVINQIAAGEVVERPYSVVKELCENALDAGANTIDIQLAEGGLEKIVVADDGFGIAADQMQLALQRHCTSKIQDSEQLTTIGSLGFRGEALASIASVAELRLTSRVIGASHASKIDVKFGELGAVEPAPAYPVGTTVEVTALFGNTPARKKFQKQARTEQLLILQLVKQLAFCHPHIGASLTADKKQIFRLAPDPEGKTNLRRAHTIFGKDFASSATFAQRQEQGFSIAGLLGPIGYHRPRSDIQYFSLNGRIIKDKSLSHAVRVAYHENTPEGRYPAFALAMGLPTNEVDINVHPTKSEVRFTDPRRIHDQLYSFVVEWLKDVDASGVAGTSQQPVQMVSEPDTNATYHPKTRSPSHSANRHRPAAMRSHRQSALEFVAGENVVLADIIAREFVIYLDSGQLRALALDKLLVELFQHKLGQDKRSRPLIVPEPCGADEAVYVSRNRERLHAAGVVVEEIGPDRLLLREIPVALPPLDYTEFLKELARGHKHCDAIDSDIVQAAVRTVQIPSTAAAKKRWFVDLLAQAEAQTIDCRDFLIERSDADWREFLTDS
ncbi:MAG: DNA mismatch repair endonuclease MutL [Pseudomonadota bacterium]